MCIKVVENDEERFGRPVYVIEIYQSWKNVYSTPEFPPFYVLHLAMDLY